MENHLKATKQHKSNQIKLGKRETMGTLNWNLLLFIGMFVMDLSWRGSGEQATIFLLIASTTPITLITKERR
jgi:hypothetical protein